MFSLTLVQLPTVKNIRWSAFSGVCVSPSATQRYSTDTVLMRGEERL